MSNGLSSISGQIRISDGWTGLIDDAEMAYLPEPRGGVFHIAFEGPQFGEGQDQVGLTFLRPTGATLSIISKPTTVTEDQQRNPFPLVLPDNSTITLFDRFDNAPEEIAFARIEPLNVTGENLQYSQNHVQTLISDPTLAYLGPRGTVTDGGFAVSALQYASFDDQTPVAVVQLFDDAGTAIGPLTRLDPFTNYNRSHTLVTLDNGNVLAVFNSQVDGDDDTQRTDLYTRTFDGQTGLPMGTPILRGEGAAFPRTAKLEDGRIIITAASIIDGQVREFFGVLAPDGTTQLGDVRPLTDHAVGDGFDPDIVATADGGFLVVWTYQADENIGSRDVYIRRYDADLNPLADSQIANITAQGAQFDAEVAVSDANEVAVIWTSEDPADSLSSVIFGRTYQLDDLRSPGETFLGTSGMDQLQGGANDDTLDGGQGRDVLDGGPGADELRGGLGDDFYIVDTIGDTILGEVGFSIGGGIDTVRAFVDYIQPQNVELLRLGNITDATNLSAIGNDAPGTLVGNAGENRLTGRGGDDQINGNNGNDILTGNTGRDTVVGGNGDDTFVFTAYADSRAGAANRDVINGFGRTAGQDDLIDLSALDANTSTFGVDDAFDFIGGARFSGTAGELRFQALGGPNAVLIEADHNGDRVADLQIFVNLTTFMTGTDFIL